MFSKFLGSIFLIFCLWTPEWLIFEVTFGFYVTSYVYISILRSIGHHGGQHINNLTFHKHSWFLEHFRANKLGSNAFITGSGRYTNAEEN